MQKPVFRPALAWCSIKNDYRTLVGLEDVDLIDTYAANDAEEEDNE